MGTPYAIRCGWLNSTSMRRTHVAALLLVAATGLLAGGCLDGTEQTATPDKVVGELPVATTPAAEDLPALKLTGDAAAGKAVFTTNCGGCHTLADAGTTGNVGPNLDDSKPSTELIVTNVTNGKGAMPPFGESLTAQQIADVAAYITQSTGG
jgi:mono/diheme cytochrome c family protein